MPPRTLTTVDGTSRSQWHINPASVVGAPTTGTHQRGEIHIDSDHSLWKCTASGTPGTWKLIVTPGSENNAEVRQGGHFLGDILHYTGSAVETDGEIQFIRNYLPAGLKLTKMEMFLTQVGGSGVTIRMGIYDQSTPTDPAGLPNAKVAEITPFTADTAVVDAFNTKTITTPAGGYTVPTTGYYWFAFLSSGGGGPGTKVKPVLTASYVAKFTPIRFKTGQTTLPASAGAVVTGGGALVFLAAIE